MSVDLKGQDRYLYFQEALVKLYSKSGEFDGLFKEKLNNICVFISETIHVSRVSVWRVSEGRVECQVLFDQYGMKTGMASVLLRSDYPVFFKLLEINKIIHVNNAHENEYIKEVWASYSDHYSVGDMLVSPVRCAGSISGALCVEHVGGSRQWSPEEESFIVSSAGFLSLLFNEQELFEALEKAEKVSREEDLILDGFLDAVIGINERGVICSANQACKSIFGYTKSELLGENVSELTVGSDRKNHDKYIDRYVFGGEKKIINIGREVIGKKKDGELFPLWLSIVDLIGEPAGEGVRFVGVCRDLSFQKKQEVELRLSQKMSGLGNLAGGVAHDFNNLLGIVLGYSQLMRSEIEDVELLEYLNEITNACDRGVKLTKKLLSFSKKKTSTRVKLNLARQMESDRLALQKVLTSNVELKIESDETLCSVSLDPSDFQDAVLNLAINAMHAMPEGGVFYVRLKNISVNSELAKNKQLPIGEFVELTLEDTGVGMDEATQAQVFDPFFSSKGELGTGLGLSQVYGFVERSKAHIKLDSVVGRGTAFYIYFPVVDDGSVGANANISRNEEDYTGSGTVLVVDNEVSIAHLISVILRRQGYDTRVAENGSDALAIAKAEHIDLVVSDVVMDGMNGYQLARNLLLQNPDMPVQLISGYDDVQKIHESDRALQSQLVYKPFSETQILAAVAGHLKKADTKIE